jgi:hypothetical protein
MLIFTSGFVSQTTEVLLGLGFFEDDGKCKKCFFCPPRQLGLKLVSRLALGEEGRALHIKQIK